MKPSFFSQKVWDIVQRALQGELIDREMIEYLLKIPSHTIESGLIISAADQINRKASGNRAEIHAQIGLNLSPCPNNCEFCAFAASNKIFKEDMELTFEDILHMSRHALENGANALFIMATGDYSFGKFLEISKELHLHIPDAPLIANIGDFNYEEGKKLKEAGFIGIYHAIRMGEGTVTRITPEQRWQTIKAAREAGLLVGTCVEPIGPEHSIEEIADKILTGREINPCYSGAMRRISIPGSQLEKHGMLTEYRLCFLVAVTRLAMGLNLKGNCTHEPNLLGATMGANLFWAEAGTNPRDTEKDTSESRGMDVPYCQNLFKEAEYEILHGPSKMYSIDNRL